MNNKSIIFVILTFTLLCITGCGSTSTPTPASYSFVKNESGNETASITFIGNKKEGGVDLHYFEDAEIPWPREGKYWSPVIFPAGRPLKLTVNIYYSAQDKGNEKIFNCPALIAGNTYRLEFDNSNVRTSSGKIKSGEKDKLVLRDAKTKAIVYEQQL